MEKDIKQLDQELIEKSTINLAGTQTEANLMLAFAGESQATNKYLYYASKATSEGYNQIAKVFTLTSGNEREHAKIWYKLLHNGINDTLTNLSLAMEGEKYEWSKMYYDFSKTAQEEGFSRISALFKMVGEIEKSHEQNYLKLWSDLKNNSVFSKPQPIAWICTNCGHIHYGSSAPNVCPVCSHPQAFFSPLTQ